MYNKILMQNPQYKRLKATSGLLILMATVLAVMMIVVGMINSRNLNGSFVEITGKVTYVGEDGQSNLVIELDGQRYTAAPISEYFDKWDELVGQDLTLILPRQQLDSTYRWVLGINRGDEKIVDADITLKNKRADNKLILTIVGVVMGMFVLASGAAYAWQKKTPPSVERDLAASYCEYSLLRQPCCKAYQRLPFLTAGYASVVIILTVASVLVGEYAPSNTAWIFFTVISLLLAVATALFVVTLYVWLPQRERRYYAEHYPFDFSDISHVAMRKKFKQQLTRELKEERAAHPHRYGEGGNGLLCDFTENGLRLSLELEVEPSANDVFGEGGDASPDAGIKHVCDLSYEELNFEAVPHYRKKDRPLFIVIKSRLQPTEQLESRNIFNDIHLLLDSNLLATLRHFDVKVENLDNLLQNKATLMEENCKYLRKNKNQ